MTYEDLAVEIANMPEELAKQPILFFDSNEGEFYELKLGKAGDLFRGRKDRPILYIDSSMESLTADLQEGCK